MPKGTYFCGSVCCHGRCGELKLLSGQFKVLKKVQKSINNNDSEEIGEWFMKFEN